MINQQNNPGSAASKRTRRAGAKRRYSIGELVAAAYKKAGTVTRDQRVAAIIASQMLATWLARSNHPEVVAQIRALAA